MERQINVICGLIVDGDKIYCEHDKKDNIYDLWNFITFPAFNFDEAIDLLKEKVRQKLKAEITDIVEFVKVPYSQLSIEVVTHSYICKISPNYKIPKSRNAGFYTIDEICKLRLTPIHHDIFLDYIAAHSEI